MAEPSPFTTAAKKYTASFERVADSFRKTGEAIAALTVVVRGLTLIDHRQWTPEEREEYRKAQVRHKREEGKKKYVKAYLNRTRRILKSHGYKLV